MRVIKEHIKMGENYRATTLSYLSYFVLLFSFDKKCPTFGPKIAQMSYFVLLLRVCVLLFNDG